MKEYAFLSNIATILTKDILIDKNNSHCEPKHFLWHSNQAENNAIDIKFPLLEKDDDEDVEFFLNQRQMSMRQQQSPDKTNGDSIVPTDELLTEATTNKTKKRKKYECENQLILKNCFSLVNKTKDVDLLNKFDNIQFESFLHMNKLSFLRIFQFIRNLLTSYSWPMGVTPQTVFSLALWKLTTDEHFEVISKRFEMSLINCRLLIEQFWRIISDNYETYIRWPNSQLSQKLQLQGFEHHPRLKTIPHVFGVIAIKRLEIFLTSEDTEIPIIWQIVCNADQKVVDCFVELEQEYKFDDTPIGQILNLNPNTIPKHSYLVGDKSFPLKWYLLRPFSMPSHYKEQEFNKLLELALTLARDTLDVMAKRFNALYALEGHDLTEVRKILETICALHNLSIAIEDDYVERKRKIMKNNWTDYESNNFQLENNEETIPGIEQRKNLVEILIKDN